MDYENVIAALPSITDWEDSYLGDGRQRLMGSSNDTHCEIILQDGFESISCYFGKVHHEIFDVVALATGSVTEAVKALQRAATFVASNANTAHQEWFGDFVIEVTQIVAADGKVNMLAIQRIQPRHFQQEEVENV